MIRIIHEERWRACTCVANGRADHLPRQSCLHPHRTTPYAIAFCVQRRRRALFVQSAPCSVLSSHAQVLFVPRKEGRKPGRLSRPRPEQRRGEEEREGGEERDQNHGALRRAGSMEESKRADVCGASGVGGKKYRGMRNPLLDNVLERVQGRDSSLFKPSPSEINMYQRHLDEVLADSGPRADDDKILLRDLLDISPTLSEAASAIIDDSFTRCFKSNSPEPWNWNIYLFPLWVVGVIIRYGILFPIRLVLLIIGWIIFLGAFISIHFCMKKHERLRKKLERGLVEFICSVFVASWTGVIKYHGPRPSRRPKQVFVANHTSMIDFIVLEQMTAFAVIMQKHPGWVGLLQTTVLESLGCIWFNRTESKDRSIVAKKLKAHVEDPDSNPLLIFPEGTCVNNEYTVMFKKGAFELDCAVCPIAIKYNKIFVDAFWNSKKQSFTMHLLRLMTSWAVVCDVWYLEPQKIRPSETSIEFAERVRDMIADRAGIKKVPWDGYLKYYRPSVKLTEKKQQKFAESIVRRLEDSQPTRASKKSSPETADSL